MRTMMLFAVAVAIAVTGALMAGAGGKAADLGPAACMEGIDTVKSSPTAEVYCGPASAVVNTPEIGKVTVQPGTCVKGIRGPGSWDLYLGTDKHGKGPWPLTLHISRPTAKGTALRRAPAPPTVSAAASARTGRKRLPPPRTA